VPSSGCASGVSPRHASHRENRDVIARIAQGAGLNDITADALRRTFAGILARGGTDLAVLADLLGNARLDTTGYYESAGEAGLKALHPFPSTTEQRRPPVRSL
jgi:site-specific recombinase XerD